MYAELFIMCTDWAFKRQLGNCLAGLLAQTACLFDDNDLFREELLVLQLAEEADQLVSPNVGLSSR